MASIALRDDQKYNPHFIVCNQQYANVPLVLSLKTLNCRIILKGYTCPFQRAREHGSDASIKYEPRNIPQSRQRWGLDTASGIDNRALITASATFGHSEQ